MPYGMSTYHMGFPGTVTLRPQTFLHVLEDQPGLAAAPRVHALPADQLAQRQCLGHDPGHADPCPPACRWTSWPSISLYNLEDEELEDEIVKSPTSGHACELETAELMALRPDRVKYRRASPPATSARAAAACASVSGDVPFAATTTSPTFPPTAPSATPPWPPPRTAGA